MEEMWSVSGTKQSRVLVMWLHMGQQERSWLAVAKVGGNPGSGF